MKGRAMRTSRLIPLAILLLLAGCGGGDGGPSTPTNPTTASEYVARGWDRFEDDDVTGAAEDFQSALDLNAAYGPALAGQGWTRLVTADSDTDMSSAETAFDAAVDQGEDGAYVLGGPRRRPAGTRPVERRDHGRRRRPGGRFRFRLLPSVQLHLPGPAADHGLRRGGLG